VGANTRLLVANSKGIPIEGSGPLRLGIKDIQVEKARLAKELHILDFPIYSREEVSVKWGTISDPWGNSIVDPNYKHNNFCTCILHSKWES